MVAVNRPITPITRSCKLAIPSHCPNCRSSLVRPVRSNREVSVRYPSNPQKDCRAERVYAPVVRSECCPRSMTTFVAIRPKVMPDAIGRAPGLSRVRLADPKQARRK